MKVWCVFGGEYSQWFLAGVFSSAEKAQKFCLKHKRHEYYVQPENGEVVDDPSL